MQFQEKFLNNKQAGEIIRELGSEFAIVKNPDYIHPRFEIYPLATKIVAPVDQLVAVVMDMDGTTTTTETLCLHSLEYMIRKITDRISRATWTGLDPIEDYPHIIGNSTTKHVEYLIQKYSKKINHEALKSSYLHAALWFLFHGKDQKRIDEVKNNLSNLCCQELLKDENLLNLIKSKTIDEIDFSKMHHHLVETYRNSFCANSFAEIVRAAIDIYYQRYHEILSLIQAGKGESLSIELISKPGSNMIEPMPGVGEFLALIKGWLGEEIVKLLPQILEAYQKTDPEAETQFNMDTISKKLTGIGKQFEKHPLKIAVVTSSIFYEANIVMTEVFRVLQKQVVNWHISDSKKELILEKFSDYKNVYDGLVTASDSSEIRLKPHRDLYSIALHQFGIPKEQFNQVVGFEDSESGTIAIRAAGIGLCVAVPFSDTQHHDLRAAAYVLKSGLPEAMVKYNLFLKI
jgi:beta-phosphoglucomutase-like phosphatase (HAD superfamily)